MLSAFDEGKIIGHLSLFPMQGDFHQQNARLALGVLSKYKNQSLGKRLLQVAQEQAKLLGYHRLEFNVRTFNKEAIALYEHLGFERVGNLKEVALIDGQYYDEFIYQKIIAGRNS